MFDNEILTKEYIEKGSQLVLVNESAYMIYNENDKEYFVRDRKDTRSMFRCLTTKNFKIAKKRFDKYSGSLYKEKHFI